MSIEILYDVNDTELRDEFLSQKVPAAIALLQEDTEPAIWGLKNGNNFILSTAFTICRNLV